jgi:hypothetical protein
VEEEPAKPQRTPGTGLGFGGVFLGGPKGMQYLGDLAPLLYHPKLRDPLMPHYIALLKRGEVYSALRITSKQRDELEKAQKAFLESVNNGLRSAIMEDTPDFGIMSEMPPDQRERLLREFREQMRNKSLQVLSNLQGGQEEQIAKILTKKQVQRLIEIDIQWRGGLALAESVVADRLELDSDQRRDVEALLAEYRTKQIEIRSRAVRRIFNVDESVSLSTASGPPNEAGAIIVQTIPGGMPGADMFQFRMPDPRLIEQRVLEAQKEVERLLKPLEAKVLKLLSADQKARWKELQGEPFSFRKND